MIRTRQVRVRWRERLHLICRTDDGAQPGGALGVAPDRLLRTVVPIAAVTSPVLTAAVLDGETELNLLRLPERAHQGRGALGALQTVQDVEAPLALVRSSALLVPLVPLSNVVLYWD